MGKVIDKKYKPDDPIFKKVFIITKPKLTKTTENTKPASVLKKDKKKKS